MAVVLRGFFRKANTVYDTEHDDKKAPLKKQQRNSSEAASWALSGTNVCNYSSRTFSSQHQVVLVATLLESKWQLNTPQSTLKMQTVAVVLARWQPKRHFCQSIIVELQAEKPCAFIPAHPEACWLDGGRHRRQILPFRDSPLLSFLPLSLLLSIHWMPPRWSPLRPLVASWSTP